MSNVPTLPPHAPSPAGRPGPHRPAERSAAPSGVSTVDPVKLLRRYKWVFLLSLVAGVILGVGGHLVLSRVYPIYTVKVLFECHPQREGIGAMNPVAGFRDEFEKFMATQVQVMASERVMDETVKEPRLVQEAPNWTRRFMRNGQPDYTEAAKTMDFHLSAAVIGDTNFIRLAFWWPDKDEAKAIIGFVRETYMQNREQIGRSEQRATRDSIRTQIDETSNQIKAQQEERNRIVKENGVDSLEQQSGEVAKSIELNSEMIVSVRAAIDAATVELTRQENELANPNGIHYDDQIREEVEKHPVMLDLRSRIAAIQGQLTAARTRLGPTHRDVRMLETQLNGAEEAMKAEREKLLRETFDAKLDGLRTVVAQRRNQEAETLDKLDKLKVRAALLSQALSQIKNVEESIKALTDSRQEMQSKLQELEAMSTVPKDIARVSVYQYEQLPREMSFPKLFIMVPLGVLLVLGLVAGTILLVEVLDQRVKGPADVALIPRTRVLGMIPHADEDPAAPKKVATVFRDQPAGVLAESFRGLRGTVMKRMQQHGHRTLLVLSGMPGSGATSVACNLALALAAAEQKVLLIDANFRRPGVHRELGLGDSPGLADVLVGGKPLESAVQATEDERLHVLTCGSAEARRFERLAAPSVPAMLQRARDLYDFIVIDVAPVMVSGDAFALANRCDATLLVVRALNEKRGMVARLRNDLGETHADFLGVLVNGVRSSAGGYLRGNILATHRYQSAPA